MYSMTFAQTCDCSSNLEWVRKTFEENDAGFEYALKAKGKQAYEDHNKRMAEKIKNVQTLKDCTPLLYEWLTFFRSGHIGISLKEPAAGNVSATPAQTPFPDWETLAVNEEEFRKYLSNKKSHDYEGIWETKPYVIGIRKMGDEYKGFIIESGAETWTKGQVKLRFSIKEDKATSVFYMRDHSAVNGESVKLTGKNHLQLGNFSLFRLYPVIEEEKEVADYLRMMSAGKPFVEELNKQTIYLRIPSFQSSHKAAIDSVIAANKSRILSTPNLIIDIRNGTGGSDASFRGLIPLLYTNPIRTVGVEFLSTRLNNQRMLDFINKPEYGFDESGKKWAKTAYEKLEKYPGKFVNLNAEVASVSRYDTVYHYPSNIGIIINESNGSTDEQFLLAAKQSKKVKLFGKTTYGVLDISNMYSVPSPCNEFELSYSLSRSMRIPDFTIDEKGIQPDYYLDKSIADYQWVNHVREILEGTR